MDFIARVKTKYDWLSDEIVADIVDRAKMFYYNLAYPCDMSVDETTYPIIGFRAEQWILAACDEIIERLGFSSALGYRENGVSWTFDNCHLSQFLISQIPPVVGVIR